MKLQALHAEWYNVSSAQIKEYQHDITAQRTLGIMTVKTSIVSHLL